VYPNGFAFQALSSYLLALTGLELGTLQRLVFPLLALTVVLPAWALYRELTHSVRAATIGVVLLFTQPEFLFVILRSSHEKFTRILMLLCLFLLVRSFRFRDRPFQFAAHISLFYLTTFAFVASNNLLAHSFIVAIASALAMGWLLERRLSASRRRAGGIIKRLLLATLISLCLVYVFTFYLYPPAQHDLLVLKDTGERIRSLFLPEESQELNQGRYTNAYAYVASGWISLPAYFLVSSANWIVLAGSFAIWARQGIRWLWHGEAPHAHVGWLLWLFYASFGLQGVLSIMADASGALASNLQHRLFPSVSIMTVAMVSSALARWRPRQFARPIQAALSAGIAGIAILSVMKATNEPLVSNKWTFYRPDELVALVWSDAHVQNALVATEYDERLTSAYSMEIGDTHNGNQLSTFYVVPRARTIVLSTVTRLRSARLGVPLPNPADALRIYDNGDVDIYHLRPKTPYQR
jgi:hypothetical protein